MTNKEIIDLWVEDNPEIALSGSAALGEQGLLTRRPVMDIDFYLPFGEKLVVPEGFVEEFMDVYPVEEDVFPYTRRSFKSNGGDELFGDLFSNKVDVFIPNTKDAELNLVEYGDKLVVRFDDILKFKIQFSFGEHFTAEKHRHDLVYIIVVNQSFNHKLPLNKEG